MTCKKCGSALSQNANFCHHCGEVQEKQTWQQPMYGQAATQPATQPTAPVAPEMATKPTDVAGDGAATSASAAQQTRYPYPAPTPQYNPYYYNPYNPYSRVNPNDAPHIGYAILCFFFPIVGLILYLVWKDEFPQRAKSAGKGALVGVITGVVLSVLAVLIWLGMFFWILQEAWFYY